MSAQHADFLSRNHVNSDTFFLLLIMECEKYLSIKRAKNWIILKVYSFEIEKISHFKMKTMNEPIKYLRKKKNMKSVEQPITFYIYNREF